MFNIPNFEVDIYGTTVEIESFLDLDMPFNGIVQSFSSLQQFSGVITLQGVPRESDIIHNLYAVTEVIVTLPEGA
ncbi:MAG: hypothetical protein DRI84_08865 [Bacteroidetes bacterium]|nr:MAG: hypothetical protein DRI84_08865 [Bacteroidota bacterium]